MKNSDRTTLKGLKNFGPVTLSEFESMGILYLEQLERMGFERVCRKWVQYYPERLNANAFLAIACALDGVVWTKAGDKHRVMVHSMVSLLRRELCLPNGNKRKQKNYRKNKRKICGRYCENYSG